MQVPSPGVLDASFHLHVFQGVDRVGLAAAGLGGDLYCGLPRCFQSPVGDIKNSKGTMSAMTTIPRQRRRAAARAADSLARSCTDLVQ